MSDENTETNRFMNQEAGSRNSPRQTNNTDSIHKDKTSDIQEDTEACRQTDSRNSLM